MKGLYVLFIFSVLLTLAQASVEVSTLGITSEHQVAKTTASCGIRTIALVVDPQVVDPIRAFLDQFEADLCDYGYNVVENASGFSNPPELRKYLKQLHAQPEMGLAGAILIGEVPHAYQWVHATSLNPKFPSLEEEVISFQYYSDLDGTFATSEDYLSPGGHAFSYDIHSGPVDWEIWVGVLPSYKDDLTATIDALKRYFAKNHAYRTGVLRRPNVFLQISELLQDRADLISGQYAWTPFSNSTRARLYAGDVSGGYDDLAAGVADFTVIDAHGYWGASGRLTIKDVETSPVRTTIFWSSGCAIGDLDHGDNFLTSVLYSQTSEVLIAKGTTNDSGGMGNNENGFYGSNIATALSGKASFGDAILSHVNLPLVYPWSLDREFYFGTPVLLGDPTLRRETDRSFRINAGLNDAWYNPVTSGQGFLVTVFPEIQQMFVAWFTFDTERPPKDVTAMLGDPGHRWLTAEGSYDGDTANLTIFVTEGGVFDAAAPAASTDPTGDGTLTIEFAGCTEGLVTYAITSLGISGEIPIQRIVPDNIALCEVLSAQ